MVFFIVIFIVMTSSVSHVIKAKTLVLLILCENLFGYGSETVAYHFLLCLLILFSVTYLHCLLSEC